MGSRLLPTVAGQRAFGLLFSETIFCNLSIIGHSIKNFQARGMYNFSAALHLTLIFTILELGRVKYKVYLIQK